MHLPEAAHGCNLNNPMALHVINSVPGLKSSQDPAFPALVGCKNGLSAVHSRPSLGGGGGSKNSTIAPPK